jgi:hypothetical protein
MRDNRIRRRIYELGGGEREREREEVAGAWKNYKRRSIVIGNLLK